VRVHSRVSDSGRAERLDGVGPGSKALARGSRGAPTPHRELLTAEQGAPAHEHDSAFDPGHGNRQQQPPQEFIDSRNSSLLSVTLIFSMRNSIESTGDNGCNTFLRMYMRLSWSSGISNSSRRVAERLMSMAG